MTTPSTVVTLLLCFLFSGLVTNSSSPVIQQIPPAIPRGSDDVDIMMSVLPEEITKRNFGKRIKDRFYAIEIIAGNNSSKSLLIEGIALKFGKVTTPTTSRRILFEYIRHHDARGLCELAFDGSLLLPENSVVKTIVFVPKTSVAIEKREELSLQAIQERLGQVVVMTREVTGNRTSFQGGS